MRAMETINGILWGPFTVAVILLCGIYHTYSSGFIQLRFPRLLRGKGRGRGRAVMSALAASMGTGNITGCAAAIAAGGGGAVFWMWVSALLGMALAYSENRLGAEYAEKYPDGCKGPMLYMEKGLGMKRTAAVYAAGCLGTAFLMGCMSQTGALADAVSEAGLLPRWTGAAIAALLTAAVVFSSEKAADAAMSAAEKIVPVMGLLYGGGCIAFLIVTRSDVPCILRGIVSSAFSVRAAAGAAFGKAVSVGLRRGIFSNEAGMGSSVLVHADADFGSPVRAGAWAAFEVFLDTVVCCTLTALVLLSGDCSAVTGTFSAVFGSWGGIFVCLCICLFAWAAVLGWCCYGERCLSYLTGGRYSPMIYKTVFCLCAAAAGAFPTAALFGAADTVNALMMLPNIAAVTALTVFGASERDK